MPRMACPRCDGRFDITCAAEFAPGYFVTRAGCIYSFVTRWGRRNEPIERRLHPDRDGYLLVKQVHGKKYRVHQLVAAAFVGPRLSLKHVVRHLNGDRTDNRAENVAWGTPRENATDRDAHGKTARGETHGNAKLTAEDVHEIRAAAARGELQREIGDRFGLQQPQVSAIVLRQAWGHVE